MVTEVRRASQRRALTADISFDLSSNNFVSHLLSLGPVMLLQSNPFTPKDLLRQALPEMHAFLAGIRLGTVQDVHQER